MPLEDLAMRSFSTPRLSSDKRDLLQQVNANMIGLVLNALDLNAVPFDRAYRSDYFQKTA